LLSDPSRDLEGSIQKRLEQNRTYTSAWHQYNII
jgi:hypothetical protein